MIMYDEIRELVAFFHHFISISAFYACTVYFYLNKVFHLLVMFFTWYLFQNVGVFSFIAIARLTSEGSTTFINIRFLLLAFDKKKSLLYTINGVLVLLAFGFFRIIPIIPIWYTFYIGISTPEWYQIHTLIKFLCVIFSLLLDILNIYWFRLIFQKVIKAVKNGDSDELESKKE